ncbi:MAG TPA: ATP-binding cassette domain-containing protein [Methylocella sp.]|nr:ATP-binding cassette domain-containing protein [Methylocella sp.]
MKTAIVSLRSVSKIYANSTVALADVNLDIGEGDLLALLGPSGCGKSTILRLIAGLETASSGTILKNAKLASIGAIGFVFQDPTLMPWANVFDNVYLPLRLQGWSRRSASPKVEALLSLVGLAGEAKALPRELSGGMRMRVSIARALLLRPPLLLMDEPFAALDEITRFKLNDDLLTLQGELGTTIVFVTHSIYEGVYLANRIVIMARGPGRIVAEINRPASELRARDYRMSTAYAKLCMRTSRALEIASGEA